jgi:hypothetical protein
MFKNLKIIKFKNYYKALWTHSLIKFHGVNRCIIPDKDSGINLIELINNSGESFNPSQSDSGEL